MIKRHVTRARRALRKQPNRDKATAELSKAREVLAAEVAWRSRALEELLPGLKSLQRRGSALYWAASSGTPHHRTSNERGCLQVHTPRTFR